MGPSRSDRPIFQNTGNERKQGCKAPDWKARPCWEARSGASHHPHPERTAASGRPRNAEFHPRASAGKNRGPPLWITSHHGGTGRDSFVAAQIINQAWSPMYWAGTWQNFGPELLEGQIVFCRTCTGHEHVGLRLSVVCACAHARAHARMALSKSYLQRESRQV